MQVKRLQPKGLNVRVVSGHVLYSHVVTVTGGTHVFIAGQLARDGDGNLVGRGDMRAQIEQVAKTCNNASRPLVPSSTTWSKRRLTSPTSRSSLSTRKLACGILVPPCQPARQLKCEGSHIPFYGRGRSHGGH